MAARRAMEHGKKKDLRSELTRYPEDELATSLDGNDVNILEWWKVSHGHLRPSRLQSQHHYFEAKRKPIPCSIYRCARLPCSARVLRTVSSQAMD